MITNGDNARPVHVRVAHRVERHVRPGPPQWVIHDSSVPDDQARLLHDRAHRRVREVRALHRSVPGRRLGRPWISYRHVYTGPVHTNTRFSILGDTGTPGEEGPDLPERGDPDHATTRFNNDGKRHEPQPGQLVPGLAAARADPGHPLQDDRLLRLHANLRLQPHDHWACPEDRPDPVPGRQIRQDRRNQVCVALGGRSVRAPRTRSRLRGALRPCAVSTTRRDRARRDLVGGIYVTGNVRDLRPRRTRTRADHRHLHGDEPADRHRGGPPAHGGSDAGAAGMPEDARVPATSGARATVARTVVAPARAGGAVAGGHRADVQRRVQPDGHPGRRRPRRDLRRPGTSA